MSYFAVWPVGCNFSISVEAESEAQARLIGAIWYLTTSMHREVLRPLKVMRLPAIPAADECVNCDTLARIQQVIAELIDAVRSESTEKQDVSADGE